MKILFLCRADVIIVMKDKEINIRDDKRTQLIEYIFRLHDEIIILKRQDECSSCLVNSKTTTFLNRLYAKGTGYAFHVKTRNLRKEKINKLINQIGR